jgi:hypothetical protein
MTRAQAGADPDGPSTFPAMGGRYRPPPPGLSNRSRLRSRLGMVARNDILILGIAAAVAGCLVGGILLGAGIGLVLGGAMAGWLLLLPSVPLAAGVGWLLALRLARQGERD